MTAAKTVKVWDLPVRLFHWSLVASFAIAYVTGEELETLHAWFGYIIIALISFRVVYGFVGSKYARFSDFMTTPATAITYVKNMFSGSPKHYVGHNPAGGWMIIVLLVSLALSSWTGLEAYAVEGHGPLASDNISLISSAYADSDDDEDRHDESHKSGEHEDEFWEELHEFFVNFTLLMVFVHIAAVLVSSLLHKENLVKAMITGKKTGE